MMNVIMLNVIMLNVIMLNVIMMNVIMLNIIMLNVVMLNVIMLSVAMLIVAMLIVVAHDFLLKINKKSKQTRFEFATIRRVRNILSQGSFFLAFVSTSCSLSLSFNFLLPYKNVSRSNDKKTLLGREAFAGERERERGDKDRECDRGGVRVPERPSVKKNFEQKMFLVFFLFLLNECLLKVFCWWAQYRCCVGLSVLS
jgi:hypothetical protein